MKKTVKLCLTAVFAALYLVLELVSISIGANIKITFSGLPIILAAILLGPLYGAAAGGIGSFISQLLTYGLTVTTPLWVLPAVVRGLSSGLLFIAFKKSKKILPMGAVVVISSLLVTIFNTAAIYLDSVIYNYYSFAYVFGDSLFRFISSILTAVVLTAICVPTVNGLDSKKLI